MITLDSPGFAKSLFSNVLQLKQGRPQISLMSRPGSRWTLESVPSHWTRFSLQIKQVCSFQSETSWCSQSRFSNLQVRLTTDQTQALKPTCDFQVSWGILLQKCDRRIFFCSPENICLLTGKYLSAHRRIFVCSPNSGSLTSLSSPLLLLFPDLTWSKRWVIVKTIKIVHMLFMIWIHSIQAVT